MSASARAPAPVPHRACPGLPRSLLCLHTAHAPFPHLASPSPLRMLGPSLGFPRPARWPRGRTRRASEQATAPNGWDAFPSRARAPVRRGCGGGHRPVLAEGRASVRGSRRVSGTPHLPRPTPLPAAPSGPAGINRPGTQVALAFRALPPGRASAQRLDPRAHAGPGEDRFLCSHRPPRSTAPSAGHRRFCSAWEKPGLKAAARGGEGGMGGVSDRRRQRPRPRDFRWP